MRAEAIVSAVSELCPTFLLVGNHDRPNNSNFLTDEHPFGGMKRWNNVYVIDTVRAYTVTSELIIESNQELQKDGYRFVFAPYVPPGRFAESLGTIDVPYMSTCIFAHQEIQGAKMGAIISKEGDVWPEERPLLVSGHIHDYDFLQSNMIYVGTPLMHAFGDKSDKTVSLFNFSDSTWTQERIDLRLIKKVTVYLDTGDVESYQPPSDKLVRLVVKGDQAAVQACMKLSAVAKLKKGGVKVVFKTVAAKSSTKTMSKKAGFRERLVEQLDKDELKWLNAIFPQ